MNLIPTISTSAIGKGRTIIETLEHLKEQDYEGPVQIAIGPTPIAEPTEHLELFHQFDLSGHANMSLGRGGIINPYIDFDGVVKASWLFRLRRYSMHPPTKKMLPTIDAFLVWAIDHYVQCHNLGVPFALETMYPDSSGHWLSSWEEVARFLEWTIKMDWNLPLVADVAHLKIGVAQGSWSADHVVEVMESPFLSEIHFSSNDGIHDIHTPFDPETDSDVKGWIDLAASRTLPLVDEGRREVFGGIVLP